MRYIIDYMEINSRINEVMVEKGVSTDELVEKTGLSRMTIFNASRGLNVTIKTAMKIAEVLSVPIEEIWSIELLEKDEEESESFSIN